MYNLGFKCEQKLYIRQLVNVVIRSGGVKKKGTKPLHNLRVTFENIIHFIKISSKINMLEMIQLKFLIFFVRCRRTYVLDRPFSQNYKFSQKKSYFRSKSLNFIKQKKFIFNVLKNIKSSLFIEIIINLQPKATFNNYLYLSFKSINLYLDCYLYRFMNTCIHIDSEI